MSSFSGVMFAIIGLHIFDHQLYLSMAMAGTGGFLGVEGMAIIIRQIASFNKKIVWRGARKKPMKDRTSYGAGAELGIGPSPTKGTANIQNANISTELGEVLASYGRVSQTPQAITNGTLTPDGSTNFTGPSNLQVGQWISVSASTVTSISTTTSPTTVAFDYLVVGGGGGGGGSSSGTGASGGGGAGQFLTGSDTFSVSNYAITIGTGGTGGTTSSQDGGTGTSSVYTRKSNSIRRSRWRW